MDELEGLDEPLRPSRSPLRWVALAVALALAFSWLLASGLGRDPRELPSELVEEPAPDVTLPRLGGGGSIDLGDLRGQVVVVNFWASWCDPCREEHDALAAAWDRYRERGVVFVGVDFEDTERAALAFAAELGVDWPIVADPGSRAAIAFGVFGVPETFVVDPEGIVTAKTVGAVSYAWLVEHIEEALRSDGDR